MDDDIEVSSGISFAYELKEFVTNIKKSFVTSSDRLFIVLNNTVTLNPLQSPFVKYYCSNKEVEGFTWFAFLKAVLRFYLKMLAFLSKTLVFKLISQLKLKYQGKRRVDYVVDVFVFANRAIESGVLDDRYFGKLYDQFFKNNKKFCIVPRVLSGRPSIKDFYKLLNIYKINSNVLCELSLFGYSDFFTYLYISFLFPFKIFGLFVKNDLKINKSFNQALIFDLYHYDFYAIFRYFVGRNLGKKVEAKKVFSWSEFQIIERTFNYGLRKKCNFEIVACQLFINYPTYFNSVVDDVDYELATSPDRVLVNGKVYLNERKHIKYSIGPSLRYEKLFEIPIDVVKSERIIILGSIQVSETRDIIKLAKAANLNFDVKLHPIFDPFAVSDLIQSDKIVNGNLYDLFSGYSMVITGGSGTSVEAVSCGISVVIVERDNEVLINPLCELGKGFVWDMFKPGDDLNFMVKSLMEKRMNTSAVKEISKWYRHNYFNQPIEVEINKVFCS